MEPSLAFSRLSYSLWAGRHFFQGYLLPIGRRGRVRHERRARNQRDYGEAELDRRHRKATNHKDSHWTHKEGPWLVSLRFSFLLDLRSAQRPGQGHDTAPTPNRGGLYLRRG